MRIELDHGRGKVGMPCHDTNTMENKIKLEEVVLARLVGIDQTPTRVGTGSGFIFYLKIK
jgi:hypothetical protein